MGSVAILDSGVLVLNRLFQAIQITSVRRAFCLLYKGDARAVQPDYTTYDWEDWVDIPVQPRDEVLATPEMRVKIPRVVLLSRFDRMPPHDVRFTRKNIYLRDRNRCQYCGKHYTTRELNLDHVVPLSRGGRSTWQNVQTELAPADPDLLQWAGLRELAQLPRHGLLGCGAEGLTRIVLERPRSGATSIPSRRRRS